MQLSHIIKTATKQGAALLLLLMPGITNLPVLAQSRSIPDLSSKINIGGNVYGGGNQGYTGGNTTVTIRDGKIQKVFGGGRLANVGGYAFVNLDGANATSTSRIIISSVYGGNDISGTVGVAVDQYSTAVDKVPAELTDVIRGTETEWKNAINNSWSAYIRTSKMTGEEKFDHAILVGSVYGGGNGDYTYTSSNDPTTGKTTHYIYEVGDNTTPIATTETDANGAGFTPPELAKAYLELNGGCLSQVYGGGNKATVTDNTVISMDNQSKGLQELIPEKESTESQTDYYNRLMAVLQELATFTGLSTFQGNFASLDYTSSRVFGGNNKATMTIQPHWNLKNGKIRDLYSGGNEGDMTYKYGILLEIPKGSNISAINVYGGCRKANVHPMDNGSDVPYDELNLPTSLGYHFPDGMSARVLVQGGDVTNVYGGNDITGRVWGGTAVGIRTSIRGDVYGGGNGSYAYTDNPDLKDNPQYADFYYEVPTGMTSVEALNNHRPHVEQTSLRLWGESHDKLTIIGGSVYVGGNSATVIENPSLRNPIVELKIGSNVVADNVFLGNNGANMVNASVGGVLELYKGSVTDSGTTYDYSQMDLTDPLTYDKYMDGCAMSLHPRIVFDDVENGDPDTYTPYSSSIGSLFCGGNVGSMTWSGTNTINVNHPIIIFDKFVAGCNYAYTPARSGLNAVYWGGHTGPKDNYGVMEDRVNPDGSIQDAIVLNLSGLRIQPRRWVTKRDSNYDPVLTSEGKPIYLASDGCELPTINSVCPDGKQPYMEWNTFDVRTGKDVANPTELASGTTRMSTADDVNRRLRGGNIYGGCYSAGIVNGNVVINVNETIMDRDDVFANVVEDDEGEGIYYSTDEYHITKVNSGVIIDEQGMDVLGRAMNIFGGGYGADTEIWGSATINLKKGYVFQVFGGAEKGVIGKPEIIAGSKPVQYQTTTLPDGTYNESTGIYAFNGYLYKADERYSTYINLDGTKAGVSRHSTDDTKDMSETEFIYGGAFEGPILGSTVVHLGNGRIFNSFAGSCNADIMGHTETYVGLNATEVEGSGFPFIRDHIYGGNDLGGKIYGSKDFTNRIREDVAGIRDAIYDKNNSPKAAAYIEYQQGRVDYIFGGCYGTYDYTDPLYDKYFYTTGGTGTVSDPTNPNYNLGRARQGFTKPRLGNAFVNFRPIVTSNTNNKAKRVYGAGQGITEEVGIDSMQVRSYVLIDIPQSISTFEDLVVFGAGSSCGLGMGIAPATATATPNSVSAVIDLIRGDLSRANVYGGSYQEGVTRRSVVNVPTISTIHVQNIFGGAYGVTNIRPCDVYEAIVNYDSDNATMVGNIYGGNNAYRRTLYGTVNISSPVWTNKNSGYTAKVYGAGLGVDTWSQYTEVNLLDGALVYEAYGGGQAGKVLNLESVNAWKAADATLYTTIGAGYTDDGLNNVLAHYNQLENDIAAGLVNREDSWRNIGSYTKKKYNTNVSIKEGATVDGYCYGGGLGYNNILNSGDVYGTTYIDLLGGTVTKDLYAAGTTGAVMDGKKVVLDNNASNDFIASANAYIKGGKVRNCYGGGWEGPVGYHDESTTATTDDILGETHVVIGVLNGPCTPDPSLTFTSGVPTVQRNAYGGGEGGVVYGTANITLNNGYIGYVYNASGTDDSTTDNFDERYEKKIADETFDDGNGAGNNSRLLRAGNLFGSGYADYSNADFTNVYLYGGVVRNSAYGGGEIGTVGRGVNSNGTVTVNKAGESHVFMYKGQVMQDVFGGGRGFDNLNRVSALGTGGYVFGLTDVNIYGGEVGTVGGVADGYGNVFGGGNLGYVYSGYGKKGDSSITGFQTTTSTEGYYYQYDAAASEFVVDTQENENILTEDCRVIVAPACQVLCGKSITLNGHTYTAGQYVPAEDLNFLKNKNSDADKWALLDADGKHSGVTIRNAVFAGGNVSSGSDQVFANTVTVYGNATATLYDIYNRDLITIGTEHVGGLYGDGNLTFVDGYRELNVSNYGTDYYGMSDNISLEDYYKLTDRERAYFELKYKCLEGYTSTVLGKTVLAGEKISSEDYDKMDDGEKAKWALEGFCTIYAGRLLNTLQRADFVGVFGSRMVLQGAQDRVPSVVDYTNYTINRVGELSLNKCTSQAGDTGDGREHGCYFGIYNIVNYLGAITSDVDFTDERTFDNANAAQYAPDTAGQTYLEWKEAHNGKRERNNGTSHNMVALASGVYLELINESTEQRTDDLKDWGYITGVCQLDLINVMTGLGGGYVYAKNEHGVRDDSGNNQTILSPYNGAGYGHAKAVTNKIYTYSTTVLKPYETSGNFIHYVRQIIDDCYPTSANYDGTDPSPAHYWFIRGQIYVYDQVISAYTGAAAAYSESVNLPLTITPNSNGMLKLVDVKENLYAYYDVTTAGSETKIGQDGILIGTTTYHLNDPITYWDWNLLSTEDRKHFVAKTYVSTAECTLTTGTATIPAGTVPVGTVLLPNEYTALKAANANVSAPSLDGTNPVPFDDVFHLTNNISHSTGYILTYDMSNPKVWDRYYTPPTGASIADNVRNKVTTATYNDSPSTYAEYIGAPTYTPTTSGVYGQQDHSVGDIIPNDVHSKYVAIGTSNHTYPGGQATVARAYVATDEVIYTTTEEHHVYKGYAISADEYNRLDAAAKAKFAPANVCTSTIELGNNEFIYYGDLLTDAEVSTLKNTYKTYLQTTLNMSATDAAAKADADFDASVSNAWYCTSDGKYGGDWYEASKNYRAVEAWSAMSDADRAHFTFNYDAFDTLIDPQFAGIPANYDGYDSSNNPLQELYSALTPVDYKATYNGTTALTYTDKTGGSHTVAVGAPPLDRVDYEKIPNEKRFYQAISVANPGTYYIVQVAFTRGDVPYTVGKMITEDIYNSLDPSQRLNVITQTFTTAGTYYFCRKPYIVNALGEGFAVTDINNTTHARGTEVTVGTIIAADQYAQLPNKQEHFTIHGDVPIGTSTLYVARQSDINDLSEDKIITVIYDYTYEESDESGIHIEEINEKHIINIHLQFKTGVPVISELEKPAIVLPNSTVGLKQPNVTPGAFEIIGGGWEMFTNQSDAEHHTNGIPYSNNLTPMYWYQNGYYVAYYAKSYLGKTYSNFVQFSVANYHDLDAVMNHEKHLFVDHKDVERNCKIYIDNRACKDDTKSELDLLKDFFDLTLHNTMDADGNPTTISEQGSAVNNHKTVNSHIRGGANLDFFLRSDVSPKAYTTWTPIGNNNDGQCFEGTLHGDGYTISGLSNSLFAHLCGEVYNLGVTGTFTSAGIADEGTGYLENCWISTTGTPASGVHAVFNDPNRDPALNMPVQVVNCYYPADNAYDETPHSDNHGDAIKKPRQSFYNGEVAYDLNEFYLFKRYSDNNPTTITSNKYHYLKDVNGTLTRQDGFYPSEDGDGPYLVNDVNGRYVGSYVERYYSDGDFIYAGGSIPENNNERYYAADGKYYPIWPDDYLFFGQMLTYGYYEDSRPHQELPAHINKSGSRLPTTNINRVYRAPAYFRNSQMGVAHYNPFAIFADQSADRNHTAYHNMTAIDFTGGNGDLSGAASTPASETTGNGYKRRWCSLISSTGESAFYPPLLDNDGLTFFRNVNLTRNLLVYTPPSTSVATDAVSKTNAAVTAALSEPVYAETNNATTLARYRAVAEQDATVIFGHIVLGAPDTYTATRDHLLVDRQDYNAPMSYTFGSNYRMWYQRRPTNYAEGAAGWEGISLPFEAELVTTQDKGELTHFYQKSNSTEYNINYDSGHEYWLREFKGIKTHDHTNNVDIGNFSYPEAVTGNSKPYTNTFLYDYYYSQDLFKDYNEDDYQDEYYASPHDYPDYPYSVAGRPYITGFPGQLYFEFDLSGQWTPAHRHNNVTISSKGPQTITFASPTGITVRVSDSETLPGGSNFGGVTSDGYTFMPSYLNTETAVGSYVLNSNAATNPGNAYVQTTAATTVSAFRPYFTGQCSVTPARQIEFGMAPSNVGDNGNDRMGVYDDGELIIRTGRGRIVVTSTFNIDKEVTIHTTSGIQMESYTIEPGQSVTTLLPQGVYIVNHQKVLVR